MQLVMCEPTLAQAILFGITSIQQLVSALEHTTLPLFHNFNKSLMLTGVRHMLFRLKSWRLVMLVQDEE